jgi:hypothetical protein
MWRLAGKPAAAPAVDLEAMIRLLFRFLATVALAVAVVMAVLDATRSLAASAVSFTPLAESWQTVSPDTLETFRQFVETSIHPLAWDPAMTGLLASPGFVVFALLALLLYAIGYRPRRRVARFVIEN